MTKEAAPKKKRRDLSALFFVGPYMTVFFVFLVLLIIISAILSLTYFDTINAPRWLAFQNYVTLFTQDSDFMQYALPTTIKYALLIGPIGYMISFFMAWLLAQLTHKVRTVLAIILYSPSLTSGVLMSVIWKVVFSGDTRGYLNYFLLNLGFINEPVQWLQNTDFIFGIMVFVGIWSSMSVGFLAMLSGILNINKDLYEAAYVDGMKSKWQEIFYITIPSMKPQMLFGAVMALVGTFNAAGIASALSGSTPPPQMAGWLIVDHMNDYGFARYEMGYASAISVILLLIVLGFNRVATKLFGERK
ncbi:MAG: sugar ABC transporter permease [Candidatus Izemoplasmatales bacterium]|jgi:multiple sugar transport system permease protein|nr:sugar ABC transporter permease [Candidatus Izemoplasmatales bacterium]MDY0373524.1 sugar ABC transporter permease [Candidatus Izemoplasmatales bacterium]